LLHLWSLSVEEQFYIFWPLAVLAVSGALFPRFAFIIGILGATAFAATFFARGWDASAAFYLMPFRIYQFSLGAFALAIERQMSAGLFIQRSAQIIGLALCAIGIFALGSHLRFQAVAPSLGAALIIYGGSERASMPLLTNPVAAYIGRISYSLYLVHWPVAVFANYAFSKEAFGPPGLFIQLALMVTLAAVSYRFVERPFLSAHSAGQRTLKIGSLIAASAVLAAISIAIIAGDGWNWRLTPAQRRINALEAFGVAPCSREETSCDFGAVNGRRAAILIGDSYAQHYVSAIDEIARGLDVRVDEQIQQGCLVLSGLVKLGYPDDRCRTGRDRVLAAVKRNADPVIISEAWMGYLDGSIGDDKGRAIDVKSETKRLDVLRWALERTIDEIARPNRRILIIGTQVLASCEFTLARLGAGPLPHQDDMPCPPRSLADARHAAAGVNDMLAAVQAKYPGTVTLVFPEDYMCEQACASFRDGIWLYQDGGHLTVAGSLYFGERAKARIAGFLSGGDLSGASGHRTSDQPDRLH
jgi:hypothetical protein